jgi:hypothetical protein
MNMVRPSQQTRDPGGYVVEVVPGPGVVVVVVRIALAATIA